MIAASSPHPREAPFSRLSADGTTFSTRDDRLPPQPLRAAVVPGEVPTGRSEAAGALLPPQGAENLPRSQWPEPPASRGRAKDAQELLRADGSLHPYLPWDHFHRVRAQLLRADRQQGAEGSRLLDGVRPHVDRSRCLPDDPHLPGDARKKGGRDERVGDSQGRVWAGKDTGTG